MTLHYNLFTSNPNETAPYFNLFKIAHLIPYLGRRQGGPVYSLALITKHQVALGLSVTVYSTTQADDGEPVTFDPAVNLIVSKETRCGEFRYSSELQQLAEQNVYDVIHSHGLWTHIARLALDLSTERNVPHLLSPCGMLQPKALRRRWWKKLPIRLWFQNGALSKAKCIQAKSETEFIDIRRLGLRNPIAVIPNPVSGPPPETALFAARFREQHCLPSGKKYVLFLGRLHPTKGIIRLIEAWAEQRRFHDSWALILAGPAESRFVCAVKKRIDELRCCESVVITGDLHHQLKWGALSASNLFVMPSDFENFGVSIAEALAASIPVITTKGTPWKELVDNQAGWWIESTMKTLSFTLGEALELSDSQRESIGERGRTLSERFRPTKVTKELLGTYQWILGNGPCPESVRL